jgi:threonine synthase
VTVTGLRCRECGAEHACDALYVCARCFGPLEVAYLPQFLPAGRLRAHIERGPRSIARYADFLPVPGPGHALPAGGTPLIRATRLGERLGLRDVWVKNDAANPTHSFKDRVVACAVPVAQALGFETIACASTGNLANSVAAHAAALGLEARVFVPEGLEPAKLAATRVHGAHVVEVPGSYDDVNRMCTEMADEWAFVNINLRPYYAEGSKTLAFEIAEQLGWELPDRCVVPIASGSLFVKMARGFEEWIEAGLVEGQRPAMSGAQAGGCAPVAEAFLNGASDCRPVKPDTIAKSLAIGNPADGHYALDVARRTGGGVDCVTDAEIVAGIRMLAETTGIFTETAGGVTTATLAKLAARGEINPDERVVLVITGDGLKTLEAVC